MEVRYAERACSSSPTASIPTPSVCQAVEAAVAFPSHRERWLALLRLIREEYPYCTMYGVHVADGVIVSCENIQRSLMFGMSSPVTQGTSEAFDERWHALESLCTRMGTGRLAELKFSDARPMAAKTIEGGRRFRKFNNEMCKQ